MANRKLVQHWPVMLLGLVVFGIFLAVLVTFEVKETEDAVVMTFGRPNSVDGRVKVYDPGLHLKWPYPIDSVWRHDNRLQCYELKKGHVEQIQTADDYQIIVTNYVLWKVGDPGLFLRRVNTTEGAEDKLYDVVRNSRNSILPRHKLSELLNVAPGAVKIAEIEAEMLEGVKDADGNVVIQGAQQIARAEYGIQIERIGFKHLGFPETVSMKVFERMKAERRRISEQNLAEGKSLAHRIRAEADQKRSDILAKAEAKATQIRGQGDEEAAKHYAVFRENPELAEFLRKLDSLRKTMSKKTTLVVDTKTPPFDLLQPGATDLKSAQPVGPKTK